MGKIADFDQLLMHLGVLGQSDVLDGARAAARSGDVPRLASWLGTTAIVNVEPGDLLARTSAILSQSPAAAGLMPALQWAILGVTGTMLVNRKKERDTGRSQRWALAAPPLTPTFGRSKRKQPPSCRGIYS